MLMVVPLHKEQNLIKYGTHLSSQCFNCIQQISLQETNLPHT